MPLAIRSKVWIENEDGKLIIGTGRVRILQAIREVGSMNKAAQKLNQPFRAVWGKIKATEERCGFKLVKRTQTGSALTDEGLQLLMRYIDLHQRCEAFADLQFRDLFRDIQSQTGSRNGDHA